ncbi:MAG: HEAT repeat domain-containing protein [Tildeniella nuda ZEHNDER 1965/U140]|jgi:HEAT repeat protein|nr:HEAT repeat domain-containing protein [Tildeniella nuda ZEHNDER 1965/U140]
MKQYSALTVLIVTVVAPVVGLLPVFSVWAKTCTQAEIVHYLEQLSQLDTPAIQKLIECDQPAVPGLAQALNSSNANVKANAAYTLGIVGRNPEIVVPKLIGVLDDRDRLVRTNAAYALGDFGIKDRAATSTLLTMLAKDTDGKTRSAAAYALGKVSSGDKTIISALIKALDDSNNGSGE